MKSNRSPKRLLYRLCFPPSSILRFAASLFLFRLPVFVFSAFKEFQQLLYLPAADLEDDIPI